MEGHPNLHPALRDPPQIAPLRAPSPQSRDAFLKLPVASSLERSPPLQGRPHARFFPVRPWQRATEQSSAQSGRRGCGTTVTQRGSGDGGCAGGDVASRRRRWRGILVALGGIASRRRKRRDVPVAEAARHPDGAGTAMSGGVCSSSRPGWKASR
jgi:hypothetical protein